MEGLPTLGLVAARPVFQREDDPRRPLEGVRAAGRAAPRRRGAAAQAGRIGQAARHGDAQAQIAGLGDRNPEIGDFADQRIVRHYAVLDQPAGAMPLAHLAAGRADAGPYRNVAGRRGRRRGFLAAPGEEQVFLQRQAGPDDGAHGDHLGGELRLVVGEAAAEQPAVLDPGAAQPPFGRLAAGRPGALGVDMGVEDQRASAAGPVAAAADQADRVDALRRHELEPGLDARLAQPGDDGLADRPLLAGIVGQVAEGQAQVGQRLPVALDAVQNGLEFLLHGNPPVTPLPAG